MARSKGGIIFMLALAIIAITTVVLTVLAFTADTLPSDSMIGGVPVGGLTKEEISATVTSGLNDMKFSIDGESYAIIGSYKVSSDKLDKMIKRAAIDPFFRYMLKNGISIPEAGFKYVSGVAETAETLEKEGITDGDEPKDAYVDLGGLTIKSEQEGTKLDSKKLAKALYKKRVQDMNLELDSKDYVIPPKVKADDPELTKELTYAKTYLVKQYTLEYPDGYEHTFTRKELSKFLVPNKTGDVWTQTVDADAVKKYVKKHAEYTPSEVTIQTKKGKKTLYNVSLVGKVDVDKACDSIESAFNDGSDKIKLEWGSYPGADTRVEVSIAHQKLWYIEDGETVFSTSVVTGGPGHGTDKGVFAVSYKTTDVNLRGRNDDGSKYSSHVDWWMPFNGDEGLHDADWRGSFGGNIYKYNGSHGCVNMPEWAAAKLYKKVDTGTIVIIY